MLVFILIVTAVLLILLALAAWRFLTVRSKGAPALLRQVPGSWRHGVVRYRGDSLEFFKLRSLSPKPDLVVDRCQASVTDHRMGGDEDPVIIDKDDVILAITHPGGVHEFAMAHHAAKAIVAWVESAPSTRLERTDHKTLLMKAGRKPRR
ncbi:DUF2550 domain-containing protein [Corynebacterium doosanense]|uniref:DUF2550 domain-containing protein n=1 Tax=Corynebacterium doosanense CAU 212 = DSM 45436 TaxID=558173 RepID=A0A097IFF4_9CORY|nr:DUF2550 domain-containing protein [Corynebacterium doosanense]AIT60858.1 hypothetical protein CDOO_06015 [Corynebacterium doosanense CAU 212 = DSM 45436]